jgi:hypothetical protein
MTAGNLCRRKRNWRSASRQAILLFITLCAASFLQTRAFAVENLSLLDQALDKVRAGGLYFRVDMSLEVFDANSTPPTVLLNTSTPIVQSSDSSGTTSTGAATGYVSLSGNAQQSISSLVNVIGSGSVINVGVNVISITNSTSDTIYTTNTNFGALGSTVTTTTP